MRQYNPEEDPPAPFMEGEVFNPILRSSEKARAKLDTGADLSVIPEEFVERLHLMPVSVRSVSGYDGRREERPTYFVHISLNGQRFEWIEVVPSRRNNILIGRDILNELKIVLDGKNLIFEVHDPP